MNTFDPVERAKEKEVSRQLDEQRLVDGVRIRNGLFDALDRNKVSIVRRRVSVNRHTAHLRKLAESAEKGETINTTNMTKDEFLKVLYRNDSK